MILYYIFFDTYIIGTYIIGIIMYINIQYMKIKNKIEKELFSNEIIVYVFSNT